MVRASQKLRIKVRDFAQSIIRHFLWLLYEHGFHFLGETLLSDFFGLSKKVFQTATFERTVFSRIALRGERKRSSFCTQKRNAHRELTYAHKVRVHKL